MTENKRFRAIGKEIWQDNGIWCVCGGEHCADVISTAINELLEEKEILELQLKSATNEIDKLMDEINTLTDTCHDCCKEIREENEQLKEENKELKEENEQLKQYIKQIDDGEFHLKQIILKRIDDYIWEWEDEGTPVAQVLNELKEDIK